MSEDEKRDQQDSDSSSNASKHADQSSSKPDDSEQRHDDGKPDQDKKSGGDEKDGDGESDKPKRKLSGRAKLILLVIGVVVLVAAILWFVRYENHGKYLKSTNDAQIAVDAVTVSPRVAGYVVEVMVADNQNVEAGQPLVRIDPRDTRARANQAEAQIAIADAQADAARAQIREQLATIEQSRAQLGTAQAKAAYDAGEAARYRPLAASGAETRQQLAQLESTARQSTQDFRAQQAAVLMQQRRVASYQAQVRQGEAQAEANRAQLASANLDLHATLIRAAVKGRIGDKTVTIGQYAQTGRALMTIVPLNRLYITANFKETQLALMRPGQPVTIAVDALDGIDLKGRVESFSPGTGAQFSVLPPQNATGNFTKITQRVPVRISIEATPSARRLLVPGLSVDVTVDTISAKGELDRIRAEQKQLDRRDR